LKKAMRFGGMKTKKDAVNEALKEYSTSGTTPYSRTLCGIQSATTFHTLNQRLEAFPDKAMDSEIFMTAARFFNFCRSHGMKGSQSFVEERALILKMLSVSELRQLIR